MQLLWRNRVFKCWGCFISQEMQQIGFLKVMTLCSTYPVHFMIFNLKYKSGQCTYLVIKYMYYTTWIQRASIYVSRSFSFSTFIKCPVLILHWHIGNIVLGFFVFDTRLRMSDWSWFKESVLWKTEFLSVKMLCFKISWIRKKYL